MACGYSLFTHHSFDRRKTKHLCHYKKHTAEIVSYGKKGNSFIKHAIIKNSAIFEKNFHDLLEV